MAGKSFVHLHLHTEFSMLDGAARIAEVVATAAADGQPAVGITDHGNMYGVLDFYKAARAADLTPVIGTEAYMVTSSRHDRPRRDEHDIYHLTLLAESTHGYRNLIKVSSLAYLDGFYQKPRVDFELLEQHHEGLVATSGCLGGAVAQALLAGEYARARARRTVPVRVRARLVLHRAAGPRSSGAARRQPAADPPGTRSPPRRCSPPTTATTRIVRTPSRTPRCSASRRAAPSTTRSGSSSTPTSST